MKYIKSLGATIGLLSVLIIPAVVHAAVVVDNSPCIRDLDLSKQVKVPGGSFVDAADQSGEPSAAVGSTIQWKLSVTKQYSSSCPQLAFPITFIIHDAVPAGLSTISANGSGSYDTASNNWSITQADLDANGTISTIINTTADLVGNYDNVASFTTTTFCIDGCTTVNYAIDGPNDLLATEKDQDASNNTANAWVRVQTAGAVLGVSTTTPNNVNGPQVLDASTTLANTGSGLMASFIAGIFAITTLFVTLAGHKKVHYKI